MTAIHHLLRRKAFPMLAGLAFVLSAVLLVSNPALAELKYISTQAQVWGEARSYPAILKGSYTEMLFNYQNNMPWVAAVSGTIYREWSGPMMESGAVNDVIDGLGPPALPYAAWYDWNGGRPNGGSVIQDVVNGQYADIYQFDWHGYQTKYFGNNVWIAYYCPTPAGDATQCYSIATQDLGTSTSNTAIVAGGEGGELGSKFGQVFTRNNYYYNPAGGGSGWFQYCKDGNYDRRQASGSIFLSTCYNWPGRPDWAWGWDAQYP